MFRIINRNQRKASAASPPRTVRPRAALKPLLAVITGLAAAQGQAQSQPPHPAQGPLEEIVVTSSRIPIPLRQIGTSVSVISAADIEAHGNLSLVDVLRQLPAISTSSNGGAGKSTTMRIRGEEGFRTLTIFDGLRMSDPSGPQVGPQLEHMLSSGVARVEILRGPQGLSYGADAGGVVNISSHQGSDGLQASLDAQSGKFGTRQYTGNVSGGNAHVDGFLSLSNYETEGFNTLVADTLLHDKDGYENTTIHGRAGVNLSESLRLDLVHRDVDGDSQVDNCWDNATSTSVHDCRALFNLQASRAALSFDGENFSHSLAWSTTETRHDNLALGRSAFTSAGELNRWEYVGSATSLPGFDLVFGADLEEALLSGVGRDNTGLYLEYLSDFSANLFLTAGVRYDDNDDFGTNTSQRVSGAYLIDMASDTTLKFKGSYGTGFRAPSPYEIAYNAGASAYPPASLATLTQETSRGFEGGIEYLRGDSLRLEAIYFDQDVDDAIFFDLADFSGYLQDTGTSNSRGVELHGELSLGHAWRLTANYTHNETARPNGEQRLRRPEDLVNLGVSWFTLQDKLNLNAYYRISRNSIDQTGNTVVALDDFEVLDLSVNYSVTPNIQLYGRLENAFDADYQEVTGYNTAERAAYIGFRLNYAGL